MKIYIEDLRFTCIIGILDFERLQPQEVVIQLELEYAFENQFINYAEVTQIIKTQMSENKFLLLEDALLALFTFLKKTYANISTLFIKITKPSILPDCLVSVSHFHSYS